MASVFCGMAAFVTTMVYAVSGGLAMLVLAFSLLGLCWLLED